MSEDDWDILPPVRLLGKVSPESRCRKPRVLLPKYYIRCELGDAARRPGSPLDLPLSLDLRLLLAVALIIVI